MGNNDVTTKLILQGDNSSLLAMYRTANAEALKLKETVLASTSTFEGLGGTITKVTGLFAGLAAGAGLSHIINDAVTWNLEAAKMARTMGVTTEQASVMDVALHSLGIGNDVAESAALKLSKTLAQGTDKFDKFGITVKDSSGNLLPMPQIMANVNQKLLETQSGTDRNIMAMTLYGRSWGELQQILRLTPEAMKEAQETAERLHLIVGPEGVAKSFAYKKGLNEIELIGHSLSIQLGAELMPIVVDLGLAFGESGVEAAGFFGHILHGAITDLEESKIRVEGFMEKVGAIFADSGKGLGPIFNWLSKDGRQEIKEQMDAIDATTNYSLAKLDERSGAIVKPRPRPDLPSGNKIDPSTLGGKTSDWTAAHNKYLEYLKAFEETKADVIKNAAAMEEMVNQQSYDLGLTSLRSYLLKKNSLQEESLQSEVNARNKELKNATAALGDLKPVTDSKGRGNPSKDAENYHEALLRQQTATKALADAQAKLDQARQKGDFDSTKLVTNEIRAYKEQQAQFLDMQNDFVGAAAIRKQLDESSEERRKLEAAAMTGDKDAVAAYWDAEAQDAYKSAKATYKQTLEYNQLGIQLLELTGQYEKAAIARKNLEQSDPEFKRLPQNVQNRKTELSDNAINEGRQKDIQTSDAAAVFSAGLGQGNRYAKYDDAALVLQKAENKKRYDDQLKQAEDYHKQFLTSEKDFADQKAKINKDYIDANKHAADAAWTDRMKIVGDSMGQVGAIMMKGNREQFEAGKELAIASATVNTISAGIAAFTGITESTGGWGMAAGIAEMAVVIATGMSQIATISSTQYQGREFGGPVIAGQSYIVGERRPELFTPGVSGNITPFVPNSSAGNINVTHVWQVSTGVSDTVRAELTRMLPMIDARSVAAVKSAQRQGKLAA